MPDYESKIAKAISDGLGAIFFILVFILLTQIGQCYSGFLSVV